MAVFFVLIFFLPCFVTAFDSANATIIAVMGPTGSGKTSFVNIASHSNLTVGNELHSCTSEIQLSSQFALDGRTGTLVDTPGFDDTERSDIDILNSIANYLAASYQEGKKLSGILYFHRISDFRMGGISARNFQMFKALCGDSTLKNVVIVTTMWDQVSQQLGEEREAELASKDCFFKPVLVKGARMMRYDNTLSTAHQILRTMIGNEPEILRIQEEMVGEGKEINRTAAAAQVDAELKKQAEKHKEEMLRFQRETEEVVKAQEVKARREREVEQARMQAEIAKSMRRNEELEREIREEQARLEQRMRKEREDAERRAAEEAAERERQAAELDSRIREAQVQAEKEKACIMRGIRMVEAQRQGDVFWLYSWILEEVRIEQHRTGVSEAEAVYEILESRSCKK